MDNSKKNVVASRLEESIRKIDEKDFNVYFFVLDTKGNPSGSLEYIYKTALYLNNNGYNVTMLHQEEDFVGVCDWLGEEYSVLKHSNIDKENVEIGPSDFLFVPEIFANVLIQTKSLPCKRVMIVQNYNHVCEFMPVGIVPQTLGVNDIITTTETQAGVLKEYFPGVNVHVVTPSISPLFKKSEKPQKLIVNIVSRNQEDVNRIVKPFFWKYPALKFVSFRDLRGTAQSVFADALAEAAITIVYDEKSNFCYSAMEAMRSGTITMVKVPELLPDWCVVKDGDDKELTKSCIWFENVNEVPDMLASIINAWISDKIPSEVYEEQDKSSDLYPVKDQEEAIDKVYGGLFTERSNNMKDVLNKLNNNAIE